MGFVCVACNISFSRKEALKTHWLNTHTSPVFYKCFVCGLAFRTVGELNAHRDTHQPPKKFNYEESALNASCRVFAKHHT